MSIEIIKEALTNLCYDKSWKCVLVRYKHKTHPNEFMSYDFSFLRHAELSALLKDICDATMAVIDKNHCTVQGYTLSNAKNVIEKLSLESQDIKTAWTAFSNSVENSDDSVDWHKVKACAYVFRGTYTSIDGEEKNLYLISKKNPIINFRRKTYIEAIIEGGRKNAVAQFEEPLLQFNAVFDCMVIGNNLYGMNLNFESIFNLPYTRKVLTEASLTKIESYDIIEENSLKNLKEFSMKGHNPKRYLTFQEDRLEVLKDLRKRKNRAALLELKLDPDSKKFILETDEEAKQLVNYLCKKLATDIEDNTKVEY